MKEQGVKIKFSDISGSDDDDSYYRKITAEIGAIYALKKLGFKLEEFENSNHGYFAAAKKFYEKI